MPPALPARQFNALRKQVLRFSEKVLKVQEAQQA
jgi:hypothetical protein